MRKLLFLFVLMFCIGAFVFSQTTADDDFSPLDAYFLGRAVAANILNSYKIYNNSEANQYLNRICQTIVLNSPYQAPYKGYFVMLLDSNEFNAFATPGGHIFITKKLAESATSEDMLAAIIAHEIGHVVLRHGIKNINESKFENEMTAMADLMAGYAAGQSADASRAAGFRDSVTRSMDALLKSGYSQTQEYEADMEAVLLLAEAGYDPNALLDVFVLLRKARDSQKGGGLFSTHPSPELRAANFEQFKLRKNNTLQFRVQRFNKVKF